VKSRVGNGLTVGEGAPARIERDGDNGLLRAYKREVREKNKEGLKDRPRR